MQDINNSVKRDQRTFIPWDESKNEAKKIGLSAWTQWYHKPYANDWGEARMKARSRIMWE